MNLRGDRFSERQRDADTRAAAAWLARWQVGTIDEEAFDLWRDADPAHALAFARVTAAWEAAGGVAGAPEELAPITRRRLIRGGGIMGAAVIAAGTGLIATRAYAWESASTRIGETRRLRLPDGSAAMLNTDSKLSWRFSSARRELWLDRGEVALDLRPGAAVRLSTEAADASLQPGRFNARLRAAALDLVVLRGVAGSDAGSQAGAYQRISLGGAAPTISPVSGEAVEGVLAWQSGDILFVDTPLADAVAEYNRYLPQKIVIDDAAVGSIRIGGRFLSSNPTDFLKAVSAGLGVRVIRAANGPHLRK